VWPTHQESKRQACLEYLCLLLGHEPNKVKLPDKCFWDWNYSVDRVRASAWNARAYPAVARSQGRRVVDGGADAWHYWAP
jgi:hypothetical protein